MASVFFLGALSVLATFSLVSFKFITVLLLVENLNILLLLFLYLTSQSGSYVTFLIFMVVATLEVTIALVCLTRLWDFDSLTF